MYLSKHLQCLKWHGSIDLASDPEQKYINFLGSFSKMFEFPFRPFSKGIMIKNVLYLNNFKMGHIN